MVFDIKKLLEERGEEVYHLHSELVNPQFIKVLKTIGFDRAYIRAEKHYLYNKKGERYVDMLGGYGVFNMGRNHPEVIETLKQFMSLQTPNMTQMDCPVLTCFLAEALLKKTPKNITKALFCNSGTEAVEGDRKSVV